jgi:hypothetical protein
MLCGEDEPGLEQSLSLRQGRAVADQKSQGGYPQRPGGGKINECVSAKRLDDFTGAAD